MALLVALILAAMWAGARWGHVISSGFAKALTALSGGGGEETARDAGRYYTCGMHPWVILPRPGTCPVCHMDLVPLDPDKFSGEVTIDPVVTQNIGVRVEPVETGPLVRTIRTVGTVTFDERAVGDVSTKVAGWIENLHVSYVGEEVAKGAPLFDLYSPDLYAAQEEYLLALRSASGEEGGVVPRARQDADALKRSARTRLEYYDISDEQIRALQERDDPSKTLTIHSPYPGVVVDMDARAGMRVEPGLRLYRIADLSRVWVIVTLYEYQLPYVTVGQRAVMSLPYIPGQTYEGQVTYVYPTIDERTREVSVRLEFENPRRSLKPGMFAGIELRSVLAEKRTLAPRAAVIDTGERQVAFVSLGQGRFEPRNVRLGIEAEGGMVEVVDGLKPGELVVTSAQFLLDSESKIREALAKMLRGNLASEQAASAEVAGRSELSSVPEAAAKALGEALDGYFGVGDALSRDTLEGIADDARRLAAAMDELARTEVPDRPHFWHEHPETGTVKGRALSLLEEEDLANARSTFADLGVALSKLLTATGVPRAYGKEVQELHCPMYREGQGGGFWLQPAGQVRNPFFGSSMLRCHDTRRALPVTGEGSRSAP